MVTGDERVGGMSVCQAEGGVTQSVAEGKGGEVVPAYAAYVVARGKARFGLIVVHGYLACISRDGDGQVAGGVHLARQYLAYGLPAIHARFPCVEHRLGVGGDPCVVERFAAYDDDDEGHAGSGSLLHHLYLTAIEVD